MGFTDAALKFDDNVQILTTAASTDYVDLGAAVRDLGVGERLYFVSIVSVAFTDGSSNSTMALTLEVDDNSSFSSATTAQTVGTFGALSAIGTRLITGLAPGVIVERYLRVKYTVANGDLTTGKFRSFLTLNPHLYTSYADNLVFS